MLLLSARLSPAATQHLLGKTLDQALIHSTGSAYEAKELPVTSHKQGYRRIILYMAKDTQFCFNSMTGDVDTSQSIC